MILSSRFISIYGLIGSRTLNAATICKALEERSGDGCSHIEILINSSGGSIDDALEVLAYLDRFPAAISQRLRFHVYGIAYSAAFVLFFCHPFPKWVSAFAQFHLHEATVYLNGMNPGETRGRERRMRKIESLPQGFYSAAQLAARDPSITVV